MNSFIFEFFLFDDFCLEAFIRSHGDKTIWSKCPRYNSIIRIVDLDKSLGKYNRLNNNFTALPLPFLFPLSIFVARSSLGGKGPLGMVGVGVMGELRPDGLVSVRLYESF